MAKSNISFSLQLLKKNKKLHYEQMKVLKGARLKGIEYGVTKKSVFKELDKNYDYHKKLYNDLVIAINILSKEVKRNNRAKKPRFSVMDSYRFA
jgi:hypothetical protein